MSFTDIIERWQMPGTETLAVRASAVLPFWVSLALVIVLGYCVARLVWLLVDIPAPAAAWSPPPPDRVPAAAAPAAGDQVAAVIAGAHLFGRAEVTAETVAADVDNAPETQLDLQLRGLVAAADERFAHAIIADASGIEKVYFVKDPLPGGASVHAIQADRVLLARGGRIEALLLPRETQGGSGSSTEQPLQQLAARVASPAVQGAPPGNGGFNDILRPQPFMPNGELKGYRIYPGRNREQFTALGLQPGDLVTEINGMALDNPPQAMELFRSLSGATQATVTIERGGQLQSLTLDITQMAAAEGAMH